MFNHLVEVSVQAGVELVPQGFSDGYASESVLLHQLEVVFIDVSAGDDPLVDDSRLVSLPDILCGVVGRLSFQRDVVEEYIVGILLLRLPDIVSIKILLGYGVHTALGVVGLRQKPHQVTQEK